MATPGDFWNWRAVVPGAASLKDGIATYPRLFSGLVPGNEFADYLIASGTGAALLGIAFMGVGRGFKWLVDAGREDTDSDPAKKMRSQLGTTFTYGDEEGEKKTASSVPYGTIERPEGLAGLFKSTAAAAVPALAAILAGGATYRLIDAAADKAWTTKTDEALRKNKDMIRKLIVTRARRAKGNASDEEIEKVLEEAAESGYVKTAGLKSFFTGISDGAERLGISVMLLTLGAGFATALGAYRYFKKSDPGNVAYKAYERGLQDYARLKTQMTPITMSADRDMLSSIDEAPNGKQSAEGVRNAPEAVEKKKPILLTVD